MSNIKGETNANSFPKPEEVGISSVRLGRAYRILEQAVTDGSLMGAAIQVSRDGVALEPRCFGRRERGEFSFAIF